ncbi:hypothetical protein B0H10DRAFT_2230582 [Mycena sp. CBHHK59/15]|nr:hypothetical protein B0H10DRAFT_2230582 [Mycena sp. CBHHK59/15]
MLAPARDMLAPARDMLAPARDMLAPARDMLAPARDMLAPARDMLAPARDMLAPARDMLAPARDILVMCQQHTRSARLRSSSIAPALRRGSRAVRTSTTRDDSIRSRPTCPESATPAPTPSSGLALAPDHTRLCPPCAFATPPAAHRLAKNKHPTPDAGSEGRGNELSCGNHWQAVASRFVISWLMRKPAWASQNARTRWRDRAPPQPLEDCAALVKALSMRGTEPPAADAEVPCRHVCTVQKFLHDSASSWISGTDDACKDAA